MRKNETYESEERICLNAQSGDMLQVKLGEIEAAKTARHDHLAFSRFTIDSIAFENYR